MEPQHGNGNNKQSELNPEIKKNPSESSIEGTIPGLKAHIVPKNDDNEQATEVFSKKLHPESSGETNIEGVATRLSRSSSSSSYSSDDQKGHIDDPFDKAEQDGYQSPEPDAAQWSMVSASPRGGSGNLSSTDGLSRTPEWVMLNSSPMKSPPLQAMGRGYDPNRIPSSIFSSKPASPMDWSVASNESLFSIHMGNNSFSRDSGLAGLEFGKPEEWSNASEAKSHDHSYTPNLPPVVETPRKNDSRTNIYVRPGLEEEFNETPKVVRGETGENNYKEKMATDAYGVSRSTSSNLPDGKGVATTESPVSGPRVSNESTKSNESFAFPVLLNDGVKGNSLKTASEKAQDPKPQSPEPQPEDPKPEAPEPQASASWFSCFKCWPAPCC